MLNLARKIELCLKLCLAMDKMTKKVGGETRSSLEKYLNNNSNGENTIIGMVIVLIRIVINVLCATTG